MTGMAQDSVNAESAEISEAIALYRSGQAVKSREHLCRFLLARPGTITALLWLARVTPDDDEAAAAAQLALKLDPTNEVAQRAVAQRGKRGQRVDRESSTHHKPLTVVTLSRYLEGEERRQRGTAAITLGAVSIFFVMALLASIVLIAGREFYGWPLAWWITYVPIGIMIGLWLPMAAIERGIDRAENYRVGRWAEEDTVEALRSALDGRWTLIRNFSFPNQKWGDVDFILVGPGGVWALEVKGYSGLVRNAGDRWEYRAGQRWKKVDKHPGKQARRNAKCLQEYLAASGAPIRFVEPVIIWANRDGKLGLSEPTTPVWMLDQVAGRAGSLQSRRPLTDEQVKQVVRILSNTKPMS